jgi:hypothetical protein
LKISFQKAKKIKKGIRLYIKILNEKGSGRFKEKIKKMLKKIK